MIRRGGTSSRSVWLVLFGTLAASPVVAQEYEAFVASATASTSDTNVPANAVDNNLGTRWSGSGDGAALTLDLGGTDFPNPVVRVNVAVYQGNARRNSFDLQLSLDGTAWSTVFSGQSSGTTLQEEEYRFPGQGARYVRYVGHGSNVGTWNSVTEISVFRLSDRTPTPTPEPTATPTPGPTPTVTPTPTDLPPGGEITPGGSSVTASTHDGNVPANAVDNNLATRWSANGDGQWLQFDLGTTRVLSHLSVAAYAGNVRRNRFDIAVAGAPTGPWTVILPNAMTNGTTTNEETFDVPDVQTRYVRYVGHGNTDLTKGSWNSVSEISLFGHDCPGCVTPTPTPTATPTPSPVTPRPTPTPTRPPGTFPPRTFAPYAETWQDRSLVNFANATGGHKYYTLAFIINGGGTCNPMWNGNVALGTYYRNHIDALRGIGGDVIVSSGGAAGTELGLSCTTVATLQAAYQRVLNAYNFKWLDLDIEGDEMSNTASIDRRNKAIAGLQAANPGLRVSYTLAVDRVGLPNGQLNLLRNALTNNTRVDVVNIMAMDYGPCYTNEMGQVAIDAARNTRDQLAMIGMNAKVGVTPMINRNDIACEVFRVQDSQILLDYAQVNSYISHIAFWSIDRDISAGYPHAKILKNFH